MGVLLFLFCRSTLVANSRNSRFGGVIGNLNSRLRGTGTHRYRIAPARFFRCKTGTSRAESKKFPVRREKAGIGRSGTDLSDHRAGNVRNNATSPPACAVGHRPVTARSPRDEMALGPEQTISASRICASRL